jgi:hypothetical protein
MRVTQYGSQTLVSPFTSINCESELIKFCLRICNAWRLTITRYCASNTAGTQAYAMKFHVTHSPPPTTHYNCLKWYQLQETRDWRMCHRLTHISTHSCVSVSGSISTLPLAVKIRHHHALLMWQPSNLPHDFQVLSWSSSAVVSLSPNLPIGQVTVVLVNGAVSLISAYWKSLQKAWCVISGCQRQIALEIQTDKQTTNWGH